MVTSVDKSYLQLIVARVVGARIVLEGVPLKVFVQILFEAFLQSGLAAFVLHLTNVALH